VQTFENAVGTYKIDMTHLFLPFLGHMGQTKKCTLKNVVDFKLKAEDASMFFPKNLKNNAP
jgi:hypothetical protein